MGTTKETFGTSTNLSTLGTVLASHIRINPNGCNSLLHGFIGYETVQLIKAPPMQPEIKFSAFIGSDSFDVFQDNCISIFTIGDNLFAYHMIPIPHKPFLFAGDGFEPSLSTASAFGLEFSFQSFVMQPLIFNLLCVKELPVTCYSNMVYSDINTQLKSVRISLDVDISGKRDMQEKSFLPIKDEVSTSGSPIKIFPIIFRNLKWNFDSTANSNKRDIIGFESERPSIISNAHKLLNFGFGWFLILPKRFKNFTGLISTRTYKLSRKLSLFPDKVISFVMQRSFKMCTFIPTAINNSLHRLRVLFHSIKKYLFFRNLEFYSCDRLHNILNSVFIYKSYVQMSGGQQKASPPTAKAVGIRSGGIL